MKRIVFATALLFSSPFVEAMDDTSAVDDASSVEIIGDDVQVSSNDSPSDGSDGLFFGGGVGYRFSESTVEFLSTKHEGSNKSDSFIATLILGAGKALSSTPIYLGVEFLLDIGKAKKSDVTVDGRNVKMRDDGLIPTLGLRLGYTAASPGTMIYGKLSLAHAKSEADSHFGKVSVSKFTPLLALGCEKLVSRKYTVRAELECSVNKDNKSNDNCKIKCNREMRLRAMIVHNTRF